MFEVKNLAFVHIPTGDIWSNGHNKESFERLVKQRGRFDIRFVTLYDLKNLRKHDTRIMCSVPAFASGHTKAYMKDYAGYPRFCFGSYHALIDLYFMDDLIDYVDYNKEFMVKDIRTAVDIRNELNGLPKGTSLRY